MSLAVDLPSARPAHAVSPLLLGTVAVLAVALLAATFAWHVPMMLWDHLDLLPVHSDTAALIRESWPVVDDRILQEIYFGRTEMAKERLRMLHERKFAPFDASTVPLEPP